jgi:hypothetical protein
MWSMTTLQKPSNRPLAGVCSPLSLLARNPTIFTHVIPNARI